MLQTASRYLSPFSFDNGKNALKTDRVIGADRIRPISETPQIELKLTPRVGHHTSSPPLEAFGVTTNGLTYRGSGVATVLELVRTDLLNPGTSLWPSYRALVLGAGRFYLAYLRVAVVKASTVRLF